VTGVVLRHLVAIHVVENTPATGASTRWQNQPKTQAAS
jgi:hypothetical protein